MIKRGMTLTPLLAPVALLVDIPDEGLTRGEMGTVVEHLTDGVEQAVLVEFADQSGQTYAMVSVKPEQLVVLHSRERAA
jgi:hypothetical protein